MKKLNLYLVITLILILICSCGGDKTAKTSNNKLLNIAVWEDRREADTLLFSYLSDADPIIRARACYALGLIAPEGASAYIAELLDDPEDNIRMEAVFTLGLLRDSLYTDELVKLYNDPVSEIRRQAIISSGKMGGAYADSVLNQLTYDTIPEVRAWACEGLWRAGAIKYVDRIGELATDSAQDVEIAAIYALSRLAEPSTAGKLRFRLRDTIPEIRMFAARGLAMMYDSSALTDLSYALSIDKDWRVKASILGAIDRISSRIIAKALLNLIAEEQHPLVAALALDVIADLDIKYLVPRMKPLLKSEYEHVRGEAIIAVARLEGEKFLGQILRELPGYDWLPKTRAAEALGYIDNPKSINELVELFEDKDHRVRTAALTNLAKLEFKDLEKILKAALKDDDWAVSATAVDLIAQQKLDKFYSKIIDLYNDAGRDEGADLRFGIVYTLREWVVDSQIAETEILELLEMALNDSDRNVRQLAIDTYAMIGQDKSEFLGSFETNINAETYGEYYGKYKVNPLAKLNTTQGPITIKLLYDEAPKTVVNFINLAESGYYDNVVFHRVVPNFVAQTGDPHGDGMGGPGYTIRCEYNRHEYNRGTVGMAHAGKDTGGSQFFICHSPQWYLNARYTAFGQVVDGLHLVDRILIGDKINSIEIIYPNE